MNGNELHKEVRKQKDMVLATESDIFIGNTLYKAIPSDSKHVIVETIRKQLPNNKWRTGETNEQYENYIDFFKTLVRLKQLYKIQKEDEQRETVTVRERDKELFD